MDTPNYIDMFELNQEQLNILYSIEAILAKKDADFYDAMSKISKDSDLSEYKKNYEEYEERIGWISHWRKILEEKENIHFYSEAKIPRMIQQCDDGINKNWFYLVMMEAALFTPYFVLEADKHDKISQKKNQKHKKLKYKPQTDYLKSLAKNSGLMEPSYVERFQKAYKKARSRISGGGKNIAIGRLSVVAVTGMAAVCGVLAGPIAVALVGSNFAGLYGAALTSTSLAYFGGGAIANGGFGMLGGRVAIASGGALLTAIGSSGTALIVGIISKNSPDLVLTQAAKLDVVMREILLNARADISTAKIIMTKLDGRIHNLQKQYEEENDKKIKKNLEKALKYLNNAYQDMNRFLSSYEIGKATN